MPALAAALRDAERPVRRAAAEALGWIGPAAVPALAPALREADEDIRRAAAEALGRIGPAAVPALLDALREADEDIRRVAAEALGRIGPAAVPALAAALRDQTLEVRWVAAKALGEIGQPRRVLAAAFCATRRWKSVGSPPRPSGGSGQPRCQRWPPPCADRHEGNRQVAAEALGGSGRPPPVVPALAAALRDTERPVRRAAVEALGRIGPSAPAVVPALVAALRDADEDLCWAAAEALRRIRAAAAGDGADPPVWDLFDLYRSPEDPAIAADLDWAEAEANAFAGRLPGTLAGLSGTALAAVIAEMSGSRKSSGVSRLMRSCCSPRNSTNPEQRQVLPDRQRADHRDQQRADLLHAGAEPDGLDVVLEAKLADPALAPLPAVAARPAGVPPAPAGRPAREAEPHGPSHLTASQAWKPAVRRDLVTHESARRGPGVDPHRCAKLAMRPQPRDASSGSQGDLRDPRLPHLAPRADRQHPGEGQGDRRHLATISPSRQFAEPRQYGRGRGGGRAGHRGRRRPSRGCRIAITR